MRTTVTIRELGASDSIGKLTQLIREAYTSLGRQGFNFNGVEQPEAVTAKRVQQGACFVALADDDLIGTILVHGPFVEAPCSYLTRPEVAYFQQFAVSPNWQSSGIGSQLLVQAETCALVSGYSALCMDTAVKAEHLVRYYARRGFEPVQQMQWPGKNYRSLVMSKPLRASD